MRYLRTLTGTGQLIIDGAEKGSVGYAIDEYWNTHFNSAYGTIRGDIDLLRAAFEARGCTLCTKEGDASIVVTHFTAESKTAAIAVRGSLP